jgi:LPPG:FO 2-phospho-L-lactate transferase
VIVALAGGVGAARMLRGLVSVVRPEEVTAVVNTGDDTVMHGLHISPDLDTVTYTLAGLARRDVGWGLEGDTFAALGMLGRYGAPTWFQVGDHDLATHVYRTSLLRAGETLTAVTRRIAECLGVHADVLPMTDGRVSTTLFGDGEWMEFQDYFVRRRQAAAITAIRYDGIREAPTTGEVTEAIEAAEAIVLVNSNPALSILPILATPGINDLLVGVSAPRVAVSPIVGPDAVSGPAGRLMRVLGYEASAVGVAETYLGVIDGIVIDERDANLRARIEALGVGVLCTQTIMRTEEDRERLAGETVSFARTLK